VLLNGMRYAKESVGIPVGQTTDQSGNRFGTVQYRSYMLAGFDPRQSGGDVGRQV